MPNDARIELGHMKKDLAFVTRALRTHLRREHAEILGKFRPVNGEIAILNLIGTNPGMSQKALAEAIVLKKSALTKAVSELEKGGLIERRKTGNDLRFNALHLTADGEARLEALTAATRDKQDELLSALSHGEREQLFTLLWRLIRDLEARR